MCQVYILFCIQDAVFRYLRTVVSRQGVLQGGREGPHSLPVESQGRLNQGAPGLHAAPGTSVPGGLWPWVLSPPHLEV